MQKWADYLISAVRYTEKRNRKIIEYFKVHQDKENAVGSGFTWSREEVINAVQSGKTFYTIHKKNTGEWEKGKQVSVHYSEEEIVFSDSINSLHDSFCQLSEM